MKNDRFLKLVQLNAVQLLAVGTPAYKVAAKLEMQDSVQLIAITSCVF